MADILKDKRFDVVFSVLMGVFLAILVRPSCSGGKCMIFKAPDTKEIKTHAYKINDKCYKFVTKDVQCPTQGVIEPFEWRR